MLAGKIAAQFFDHAGLRVGQIECKRAQKFLEQRSRPAMRLSASQGSGGPPGSDQHLHGEELGEDEVLARRFEFRRICGKMNLVQRVVSYAESHVSRQSGLDRGFIQLRQRPMDQSAEGTLRQTFGSRIDRSDPPEVHRHFLVVLDHLELGMLEAQPLPAQTRLAENHEPLPGRDHFLHVMKIEPAQDKRLAQRIGARFLQRCFEDFFPSAETTNAGFHHFAAETNGDIALFARESGKLGAILIAAREMGE